MKYNDADVIRAARDYIASGKWHQGSARNPRDRDKVCAITALWDAADELGLSVEDNCRVERLVEKFAPPAPPKPPFINLRRLAAFNDDPNTKLEDVVNVFDKALAELGEHHVP